MRRGETKIEKIGRQIESERSRGRRRKERNETDKEVEIYIDTGRSF